MRRIHKIFTAYFAENKLFFRRIMLLRFTAAMTSKTNHFALTIACMASGYTCSPVVLLNKPVELSPVAPASQ